MSKGTRKARYAVLLLAIILSSTLVFLPVPAYAASPKCGGSITKSTTLKANIGPCSGNGLVIGGNGITLNCAGHTVAGSGIDDGIVLSGRSKVVVKNCDVTGFEDGVYISGSSSNTFTSNIASYNDYGFFLTGASSGNKLMDNTANYTTLGGFAIFSVSSSNRISGNTADGSDHYGFYVYASTNQKLTSNKGSFDGNNGFYLVSSSKITLTGNTASANGNGFYLYLSTGNKIGSNRADSNSGVGYEDTSTGSGTAGTASTYTLDECSSNTIGGSYPTGLCAPQA